MRTEAEIREKISFLSGYLNAGIVYGMPDKEAKTIKAVIRELEWVLDCEVSDVNN